MKNIFYLVFLIICLSCESKVVYKKPENLIPKEQMIDLLYDMHLANATSGIKNKNGKRDKNYLSLVYEKHKIDSTQFAISNTYYVANIKEYEDIFEEVQQRLNTLQESYTKERDSILNLELDSTGIQVPRKHRKDLDRLKKIRK